MSNTRSKKKGTNRKKEEDLFQDKFSVLTLICIVAIVLIVAVTSMVRDVEVVYNKGQTPASSVQASKNIGGEAVFGEKRVHDRSSQRIKSVDMGVFTEISREKVEGTTCGDDRNVHNRDYDAFSPGSIKVRDGPDNVNIETWYDTCLDDETLLERTCENGQIIEIRGLCSRGCNQENRFEAYCNSLNLE